MAFWACQLAQQQHLQQQWQALQSQLHGGMEGSWSQFGPHAAFSGLAQGLGSTDSMTIQANVPEGGFAAHAPCVVAPVPASSPCLEPQAGVKKVRPSVAPSLLASNVPVVSSDNSPSKVFCKFGRRCTRLDCWYVHPNGRNLDQKDAPDPLPTPVFSHAPAVSSPSPRLDVVDCSEGSMSKTVYEMLREVDVPWPRRISLDGKLGDLEYSGSGLPLHFLHPLHPRMQVSLEDFVGVLSFLRAQGILACEPPKLSSPGVLQAKLGSAKGSGNLQVYPGATGRSGGNARLNCGQLSQVRDVRSALLRSQWFWPAGPNFSTPLDACGKLVQMADGRLALPPISPSTKVTDLKSLFQDIAKRLGAAGKAALVDYVKECGVDEKHEVWPHIEAAFVTVPSRKRKAA